MDVLFTGKLHPPAELGEGGTDAYSCTGVNGSDVRGDSFAIAELTGAERTRDIIGGI